MRTAIVSDMHLGAGSGADLLRRPEFAPRLLAALEGADRVVLLGDVLELRDRPLADVLADSREFIGQLGEVVDDGELVIVAGNHDHHLAERWLERVGLDGGGQLGLEQRFAPGDGALGALAGQAGRVAVEAAYPGLWVRDGVYATHGHFLDRHLTVPTFERLGIAVVERILGIPPGGPDPLAPPDDPEVGEIEEYERVLTPVYAFLFQLAQSGSGGRSSSASPSMRIWSALGGGETRAARLRGWLLGSVAVPGAVGIANRLGLGPVRADLSPGAITRAALLALGEVIERLAIDAEHVVFGHTHRRGPFGDEPGWSAGTTRLWNTGSWVHSPALLRATAAESPYWPGTVCFVGDTGEPELVHLLDDLERGDLGRGDMRGEEGSGV